MCPVKKYLFCCTILTCINGMEYQLLLSFAEMVYIPPQCDASALFCHATVYNLFSFENFSNPFDKNTVSSSIVAV